MSSLVDVSNSCMGLNSLAIKTSTAINNIALGLNSGGSLSTGISGNTNICIGANSMNIITSGSYNVGLGFNSTSTITTGKNNIGLGIYSLNNLVGINNQIGIGTYAGNSSTIGNTISIGYASGQTSTTNSYSINIGALTGNTSQGTTNIAIGYACGQIGQSGNCIAIGNVAGQVNQGLYSVGIGCFSGNANQPANCIIINATSRVITGSSNTFKVNPVRATAATTAVYYNTTTSEFTYLSSSLRYKKNIEDLSKNTSDLWYVRPVQYIRKDDIEEKREIGLIAEEVYEITPDFAILDKNNLPDSIDYYNINIYLLNEVKKMKQKIVELKQQLQKKA